MTCYVIGCHQPVTVGSVHKLFGRVESCASHYPDRVGYARALGVDTPRADITIDHFAVPDAPPRGPVSVITVPEIDAPF